MCFHLLLVNSEQGLTSQVKQKGKENFFKLQNCLDLSPFNQNVMDQFNPGLRNLINLGKNYEKSVAGEYLCYMNKHSQTFREKPNLVSSSFVHFVITKEIFKALLTATLVLQGVQVNLAKS